MGAWVRHPADSKFHPSLTGRDAGRDVPRAAIGRLQMKNFKKLALGAVAFLAASSQSFAVTAYDSLTAAVSWTDVTTAILSVAAMTAAVLVTVRGIRFILGAIRR